MCLGLHASLRLRQDNITTLRYKSSAGLSREPFKIYKQIDASIHRRSATNGQRRWSLVYQEQTEGRKHMVSNAHKPTDAFSVMTLNLRFGLAKDGPNAWRFRKKILPKLFVSYPADFIGFQEVNDFQFDDLNAILTDYRSVGKREPAPAFWQSNVIYYKQKWDLILHQHFYLSPTPSIPSRARASKWPRQCTIGIFRRHHHHLTCINTHLDFEPSVQAESSRIIMERLSNVQHRSAAVLMGDFNASIDAPHFNIFTDGGQKDKYGGIVFKSALTKPYPGTHHGFSGTANEDCIDWILFTDETIQVVDSRIIRDHVNGAFYSDHFPVLATFKWRP